MSVKKIHLFPSEKSYVDNSGSIAADDLALVPLNLSFNNLSDKPEAYITETWHSGTSWYRVWSDGFIEQGGSLTPTGTASISKEITFNKPFASSMIGLSLMAGRNSGSYKYAEYGYDVYNYSTTKVAFLAQKDSGSATTLWWYANGY
jgi:hypothetical protein|nr:MAG TPA: hypothetical protein [Caudoviricetes sp.]